MEHRTKTKTGVTNVHPTFCSFDIEQGIFYKFRSSGTQYNWHLYLTLLFPNAPFLYPRKHKKGALGTSGLIWRLNQ